MKKSLILSLTLSLFIAIFAISFVSAQTDTTDTQAAVTTQATLDDSSDSASLDAALQELENNEEDLSGVQVEDITSVPSGFGLWLRTWRERISVALTFDPVKKAEKRLVYAEERMKIAEKILEESTSDAAQAKAQQMIDNAQSQIDKIQESADKWVEKQSAQSEQLKNNLAAHLLRRDAVLEKIEEQVPEDQREKFEALRDSLLEKGKALIGDIDDGDTTEATAEHLINVRERVEANLSTVKQFQQEKKDVLDNPDLSQTEKKEQINLLADQRKTELQKIRLEYKEKQQLFVENAQGDNAQNQERAQIMQDAKELIQQKQELIQERAGQIQEAVKAGLNDEELKTKFEEMRQQYQERLQELKDDTVEARRVENEYMDGQGAQIRMQQPQRMQNGVTEQEDD